MILALPVAYGILFVVALLVLVGFVIIFTRLEKAVDPLKRRREPMPVAWPISPQAKAPPSAPSAVEESPAAIGQKLPDNWMRAWAEKETSK